VRLLRHALRLMCKYRIGKDACHLARRIAFAHSVFRRYGMLHPETVSLPGTDTRFCIDPLDNRAYGRLVLAGVLDRMYFNRCFWLHMADALQPDTVLDIGANYGECFFSPMYPQGRNLVACEANPALSPLLESAKATRRRTVCAS